MNNKYDEKKLFENLKDPKKYLENFCKIKTKKGGLRPFILNEAQKDIFNTIKNHNRVMICKARQIGFCFHPYTKILTSELRWKKIVDLKVGNKIIASDESVNGGRGSSRKMRTAIIEGKSEVYEYSIKLKMDDGRDLILTPSHRMLCKVRGAVHTQWRKAKDIRINDEIRYITKIWDDNNNYEDGWISGIIDGEGCLRTKKNAGTELTISQIDGYVWDRILKYFGDNNYSYRVEVDKRLSGTSSKYGSKPVNKLVLNKMDELFYLIGKVRPSRFIDRHWWEDKKYPNNGWLKVSSIELLPRQRMIDLQTSEGTYIANGFVSHNSTAITGYFYHSTIMNPGTTTALIGYNSDLVSELLDKVKTFYRTTPPSIRPTIRYNSKYEISFPKTDSKIMILPSSENVGSGYTLNNCLLTELPKIEKAEEKMASLFPAVPLNGKFVIESSPKGQGNLYHRMWMTDNEWVKKKYGWWWGYCLDDETEILTVKGWKNRKDFNIGDKHFTVNLKTKKLEIKKATDKFEYDYEGNMAHFESHNLDMLVTPNHKCIYQRYHSYNGSKDWKDNWMLKMASEFNTNDVIPVSTMGWHKNKVKKYTDEFVELIGWVITEASYERYLIYIYQNVGKNLDRIENLCKILGLKYTRYIRKNRNSGEIRIHSQSTKNIRKVLSKSKELPLKFILSLTYGQMVLLQKTMIEGDGWNDGGGGSFVQKDKDVSNNFQILTTLIGNTSRIKQNKSEDKCYIVKIKNAETARKFSIKNKRYNGKVWCPTNDNGTIVIRRNGKVMITGQSKEEINQIKNEINNPQIFAQEYEMEFLASGRSVFDQNVIKKQRKNVLEVGDKVKLDDGTEFIVYEEDGFIFYEPIDKNGLYIFGCDSAEGVEGGDYSTAIVWNRKTGNQAAMYRDQIATDRFGELLDKWGRRFNNALMVVEHNSCGLTVILTLKKLVYPSMYFRPTKVESISSSYTDKLGWRTTGANKQNLIDDYAQVLRDDGLIIHSKILLDEMSVFIYDDNNNMKPQPGFHDDTIMGAAIGFQGFKIMYGGKLEQLDYENYMPKSFAY